MTINLNDLFAKQRELDAHIQANHHLTYASTREKRLLALLVELGEFANETRAFKFWSLKSPSPIEKILDEYADGMHFFLSLGIDIGSEKHIYQMEMPPLDLTNQVLQVYHLIDVMGQSLTVATFEAAFASFLNIPLLLGRGPADVIGAYYQKLGVNYKRQQEKY
ncbi:MAG TPA: dUTPase [Firmicutes bacterium]|jgi:dimeric dUTPase (all-alpha-NTP-PPase superfamily)|nr:dUTPase [Bacillota bacterium]